MVSYAKYQDRWLIFILTHLVAGLIMEKLLLSFAQWSFKNPFVNSSLKEEEHMSFLCCSLTISYISK